MTIRDGILGILRAQPGNTAAQVRESMHALGICVAANEPYATLNRLVRVKRAYCEGTHGSKRYFALTSEGGIARDAGPAAAPASDPVPAVAEAPVADADAARLDLANVIVDHLKLEDTFASAEQIAADITESRHDVALAIALLMRQKRVTRRDDGTGRWVYRDVRPADAAEAAAIRQAIFGDKTKVAEPVSSNGKTEPESFASVPASAPVAAAPRMTPEEFVTVQKFLELPLPDLDPADLPGAIRLEMTALDDLLGQACDTGAPHPAIKGLVVAQGALRRALEAFGHAAKAA